MQGQSQRWGPRAPKDDRTVLGIASWTGLKLLCGTQAQEQGRVGTGRGSEGQKINLTRRFYNVCVNCVCEYVCACEIVCVCGG